MSSMGRILLLVLSFVLSIVLWVYVQVQENPTRSPQTSYSLEVKIRNKPGSMEVTRFPDTYRVFPVGPRDELTRIDESDLSAFVDLTDAKLGTNTYPVNLVVRGDYKVRWDQPGKVAITLERTKTKVVPVRVQIAGSLSNPDAMYLPDSTYVDPPTILISGPEPDVDRVQYARAILDLTRVSPGKTYLSDVELLEDLDRPAQKQVRYDDEFVTVHPAVAIGLETRSLHIQPFYFGQPAPGFMLKEVQVTPDNITVRGRPVTVSGMGYIRTERVDLAGLKASKEFSVAPILPPDVVVTSPQVIKVRVVIEPIAPTPSPPPGVKPGTSIRRAGG